MSNKGVAHNRAPLVIQQPLAIVSQQPLQSLSGPGDEEVPGGGNKEPHISTQAEVSQNQPIELNNRDQTDSQPNSTPQDQPEPEQSGDLVGVGSTEADTLHTSPSTPPSNTPPKINPPPVPSEITLPNLEDKPPTNSLQVSEGTSTPDHSQQPTNALDSISSDNVPKSGNGLETREVRKILVRTVPNNEPKPIATKEQLTSDKESTDVRPKIKVQAKQPCMPKIRIESAQHPPKIIFESNQYQAKIRIDCKETQNEVKQVPPKIKINVNKLLPKVKVEVRKPQNSSTDAQQTATTEIKRTVVRTDSTEGRRNSGEPAVHTCEQEGEKSAEDTRGRREEARLKRRAERQAKLRAETMSGTSNSSTLPLTPTTEASPSLQRPDYTLPFRSPYCFSSLDFSSPDSSRTPNKSREKISPTPKSSESHLTRITYTTPTDQTRDRTISPLTPKSDPSLSGFMKPESTVIRMKPGSFMLYPKEMPTAVSPSEHELSADPYSGPFDISDSPEAEPMEDTGPESMEEEKSSCRDTTPTQSSRTATATVSPSHSSFSASHDSVSRDSASRDSLSRGSRSRSWTKSSSQSKRYPSRSRSRSHNSSTSSTTPTRVRKPRRERRRHRRTTPSTPSMRSQSRTPTPTRRHSSKRKKEKSSSSESPVPRKYRSSTDEFDPDYAAFTEVPPGNRDTDAFAYFGNPNRESQEREHTPHSYSTTRTSLDRYSAPRPYNPRYTRPGYTHNHAHSSRGHEVQVHEHSSPRNRDSYRGYAPNYQHSSRERSNYSGSSFITSPQRSGYQQYRGNYNNYNHQLHRGSYNTSSYQKPPNYSGQTQQRGQYNYPPRGGYTSNYYQQRDSFHSKRQQSDTGGSEKKDNSGFGAFYRKDEAEWEAEEDQSWRIQRNSSPSSSGRTVPARLAGRLGPLPSGQYHKNESILWKGGSRGRGYQDRSTGGYKKWRTDSYNNSEEEYKLNLKIKDIIAKNEEILRRKIEVEEDKMIHGVS